MEPDKVNTITKFPTPQNTKSLQRFLGLVTFSLRFIPHLVTITAPLHRLLQKREPFIWTSQCQNSFMQLKGILTYQLLLQHPDFSKPFKLQIDASNEGIGAVLLQQDDSLYWFPIAFVSHALTKPEKNYSVAEKEILAVVWAFTKFHPYLHGAFTTLETDHQPVISLLKKSHPPGRLLCWVLFLQDYNLEFKYCPGIHNILADELSRLQYQAVQLQSTNNLSVLPIPISTLKQLQQQDSKISHIIYELKQNSNSNLHNIFLLKNDILYYVERGKPLRFYVPQPLYHTYLQYFHDHILAGHQGFHKMLHKLRQNNY